MPLCPLSERDSDRLEALFGVYALYWRLDEQIEDINLSPPLSRPERHLLVNLATAKRMGDLAREMFTQPSTITAAADQLEARGLIARRRDPTDRRAWLLELTDEGAATRRTLIDRASALFDQASGLDQKDTELFARLLGKIREHILQTGIPEGLKK